MNAENHWAAKRPIPFANVSGETIPAFAVMAVTGLAYENGVALLECARPSSVFQREYAVNNRFDVPAGLRGTCFRSGEMRVLFDSGSPAAGEGWGPKPDQWKLFRGFPGFATQGVIDGDHKIAKALFEPVAHVLARTTAAIAGGTSTQNYRIYAGVLGSETDAGYTTVPTAHNRASQVLAAGRWVRLTWVNNGWELVPTETPAPRWFLASLAESCTHGTNPVAVTATAALDGGEVPEGTLSAANPLGLSAQNAAPCLIVEWITISEGEITIGYLLVQPYHVVREPLVAAEWDLPNLTVTKQKITVMHEGDPEDAETILTAGATTVIESVDWESPSLTYQPKTIYVLGTAPLSPEIILTASEAEYVSDVNWSLPNLTYDTRTALVFSHEDGTSGNAILTAIAKTAVESVDWSLPTLSEQPVSLYVLGSAPLSPNLILTAAEVSNVIDVSVDGLDLEATSQTQYVFAKATADAPVTVFEGGECPEPEEE